MATISHPGRPAADVDDERSGTLRYRLGMTWSAAVLWGLLGGGLVEAFDLHTEIRRHDALPWRKPRSKRRDPARPAASIYALASGLRLFMGCGVAGVAGASAMVGSPWVAVSIGVAAPLIIERLLGQIPLVTERTFPQVLPDSKSATRRVVQHERKLDSTDGSSLTGNPRLSDAGHAPVPVDESGGNSDER